MNIAVIGAGAGGTKLINLFHEYQGLNVVSSHLEFSEQKNLESM